MKTRSLLIALSLLPFIGCDVVKDPVAVPGSGVGPVEGVSRKILLEDFTGHRCNNCPDAARTAANLKTLYGEELVIVGVHCTFDFASPSSPPNADGSYSTDFRTPAGDAYENTLGVNFLPNGAISRKVFNSSLLLGQSAWGSAVADLVGQEADYDVWFSQLDYNSVSNTVSAEVKVAVLKAVTGDHNLTIYLTEDHIIDWQLDNQATPPNVPNYEHRHVLRTNLNGAWGAPVVAGTAAVGDTITLSYPNFPLNSAWVGANCALVAYVYETASYEVKQVEEGKFQP